jgi:hypothetical protein
MKNPWKCPRDPEKAPECVFISYSRGDKKTWPHPNAKVIIEFKRNKYPFVSKFAFAIFECVSADPVDWWFVEYENGVERKGPIPENTYISWQYFPEIRIKLDGTEDDYLTAKTLKYQRDHGWRV